MGLDIPSLLCTSFSELHAASISSLNDDSLESDGDSWLTGCDTGPCLGLFRGSGGVLSSDSGSSSDSVVVFSNISQ